MNILLIGGRGFIGSALDRHLSQHHSVDVLDLVDGYDINSVDSWQDKFHRDKYDVVVFLAGAPNLRSALTNPRQACMTATVGLQNALEWYFHSHFVYISSSMVYGNWTGEKMSRHDTCSPVDLYGRLKLVSEELVKQLHPDWNIIRPSAVYGPGDCQDRVIPKWITQAQRGEQLMVLGADTVLDLTYIDDLVSGIELCLTRGGTGQIWNITRGEAARLADVAEFITERVGSGSLIVTEGTAGYPRRGALDIEDTRKYLGYNPTTHWIQGVTKTIDYMENCR